MRLSVEMAPSGCYPRDYRLDGVLWVFGGHRDLKLEGNIRGPRVSLLYIEDSTLCTPRHIIGLVEIVAVKQLRIVWWLSEVPRQDESPRPMTHDP